MTDSRLLLLIGLIAASAACAKGNEASAPTTPEPEATPVAREEPAATPEAVEAPEPAEEAAPANLGPAPAFTLTSVTGEQVSLADHRGKVVVLEWFNPGCPFVKYAHGKGPLAEQPARRMGEGIVWLAINSGAPGKQGHGAKANKSATSEWKMTYPVLTDESGAVGQAYEAKTTPHMFVIDPEGNIVYRGALDNAPLGQADQGEVVNYVDAALDALAAGEAIDVAETKSYGCSVKYGG